jgi:hypothetical protein
LPKVPQSGPSQSWPGCTTTTRWRPETADQGSSQHSSEDA